MRYIDETDTGQRIAELVDRRPREDAPKVEAVAHLAPLDLDAAAALGLLAAAGWFG